MTFFKCDTINGIIQVLLPSIILYVASLLCALIIASLSTPTEAQTDDIYHHLKEDIRGELLLTPKVQLGGSYEEGNLMVVSKFDRNTLGDYFVESFAGPKISIFNGNGQFQRNIESKGEGPGEYLDIDYSMVGPGDSLYVFDTALARCTVLSPTFNYIRSFHLPEIAGAMSISKAVILPTQELVLCMFGIGRNTVGHPLHIFEGIRNYSKSFGGDDSSTFSLYNQSDHWDVQGGMDVSPNGTIWMVRCNNYRLEEWSLDGELLQVLSRDASWFPAWDDFAIGEPTQAPPVPKIWNIQVDDNGLIWVIINVADENWSRRQASVDNRDSHEHSKILFNELPDGTSAIYDSIIEVIDPESKSIIYSQRVPYYIKAFAGEHLFARPQYLANDEVQFTIFEASIIHK